MRHFRDQYDRPIEINEAAILSVQANVKVFDRVLAREYVCNRVTLLNGTVLDLDQRRCGLPTQSQPACTLPALASCVPPASVPRTIDVPFAVLHDDRSRVQATGAADLTDIEAPYRAVADHRPRLAFAAFRALARVLREDDTLPPSLGAGEIAAELERRCASLMSMVEGDAASDAIRDTGLWLEERLEDGLFSATTEREDDFWLGDESHRERGSARYLRLCYALTEDSVADSVISAVVGLEWEDADLCVLPPLADPLGADWMTRRRA